MPRSRGVHLLLEHALVGRADGVLRPSEDPRLRPLCEPERELRHGLADAALDPLRPIGDLVVALALPPLLRPVRVSDRHAHDGDRRVHAAQGHDARNASPRTNDHPTPDLLSQDAVRRADVALTLGRDRGGFQPEAVCPDRLRRIVDDVIAGCAPVFEREIEARELELEAGHLRREDAQPFLEQLLPRLVAFQHHDRPRVHRRPILLVRFLGSHTSAERIGDGISGWRYPTRCRRRNVNGIDHSRRQEPATARWTGFPSTIR